MKNRTWFSIALCVSVLWFAASMKGFIDGSKPVSGWIEALLWSAFIPALIMGVTLIVFKGRVR